MKLGLGYDSETDGLPIWNEPSVGENQPHLVQLAAKLINLDDRLVIDEMSTLIIPDGWDWDDTNEAFKVHGITAERCRDEGVSEVEAVEAFFLLWERTGEDGIRIGHSETFDRRMIRIATKRYPELRRFIEPWKEGVSKERSYCTMFKSKKAFGLSKTPKLVDIYKQVTGKEHTNAHDAMGDVDACIEVYYKIQDHLEAS